MVFLLTTLLILAADQLSKMWIRSNLAIGQSLFEAGFFRITHIYNTGAPSGFFAGQSLPLPLVALLGIATLLLYVFLISRHFPLLDNILGRIVLGLILGGTLGNLIDRLRFGYVTDFIDIGIWPTFNIADSAIVVGVIIFAYSFYFLARARKS